MKINGRYELRKTGAISKSAKAHEGLQT